MAQLYLLRLMAMNTCDECDIVPSAEFIVDEDLGTTEHSAMDVIHKLQNELRDSLKGAPITNLRPMTPEEIRIWRDQE
jgi:hypothetical protein